MSASLPFSSSALANASSRALEELEISENIYAYAREDEAIATVSFIG